MKKLYAFFALALPLLVFSQTNYTVTFKVNTANIVVGANGIYAGGGVLGDAQAVQLSDPDGNGVWTGSATVTGAGGGNFIFLNSPANGGDWGTKESLGGMPCSDPSNWDDRVLPSFSQDTTLMFCFGTCQTDTICPTPQVPVKVTFQSDRRNSPAFTNAYLSGTFPTAWSGTAYPMLDDDGDSVYTVEMMLVPGDYRYKFTADDWALQESFNTSVMSDTSCVNTNSAGFTDRVVTVGMNDTILDVACWEQCGPCSGIGIVENSAVFSIYPNPTEDILTIKVSDVSGFDVVILNVLGQEVQQGATRNSTLELNVSHLPSGLYFAKLKAAEIDQVLTFKKN